MDDINPKCYIAPVLPVVKVVWVTRHCPYSGSHQTLEFLVRKLRSRASKVERQNMNNREENFSLSKVDADGLDSFTLRMRGRKETVCISIQKISLNFME